MVEQLGKQHSNLEKQIRKQLNPVNNGTGQPIEGPGETTDRRFLSVCNLDRDRNLCSTQKAEWWEPLDSQVLSGNKSPGR